MQSFVLIFTWLTLVLGLELNAYAQETSKSNLLYDSAFIAKTENQETEKVLHAEPLYIDLIRDLGARKGEKEWNLGFGLVDKTDYDAYEALVEYEFAPINRLGFEIELPIVFYSQNSNSTTDTAPKNKVESLKLATQWSFYVSEKRAMSMAIGYINELHFAAFSQPNTSVFEANGLNPFMVIAKRWGNNFHTLLYTGPVFNYVFEHGFNSTIYEINTSFHYMIPGTGNFVGIEFNKSIESGDFDMVMRPQMRLYINEQLLVGIVSGIPVSKEKERLSMFLRLIWEPASAH